MTRDPACIRQGAPALPRTPRPEPPDGFVPGRVAKRNPARKPGRVSALAAGALAVLAPAWGAPACAGTLDVVVGVSAGTTGPRALVGQDFTNGVVLALEDLNARNARIGSDRVVWKVLAEDDQADPRQAAVVAQKFIDAKVSGVVGPDTS